MSRPFVGREAQLDKLNKLLSKKTASLVVIRGRRRIGKSRLVEEFAKKSKFLLFTGLPPHEKTNAQLQREEFARQLQNQLKIPGLKAEDWADLFTILAQQTNKGRAVILLDEISWMGSKDPTFLGKLKIAWDTYFSKNTKLILILCGSVSSWIEKNIISSTGFFGRISEKIILEELSLPNCNRLLDALGFKGSYMEKFTLLSIVGGIPWYLELINPKLSAIENIRRLCFEKDGVLFDEFHQIFYDLFGRRSDIYQKIVQSLVDGPKSYQDISHLIDYPTGGPLSGYLDELVLSGYLEEDHAWSFKTQKELKLNRYRLSDNYLRFYFKSIQPNLGKIKRGHFTTGSIKNLPGWDSIIGYQFENLVLKNRFILHKKLNIDPSDIVYDNSYFQNQTTKQKGCQIDYLIQTRFNTIYLCEIKFSKNKILPTVISEVEEKRRRLNVPKNMAILPVLISVNEVNPQIKEKDFFVETINFSDLLF